MKFSLSKPYLILFSEILADAISLTVLSLFLWTIAEAVFPGFVGQLLPSPWIIWALTALIVANQFLNGGIKPSFKKRQKTLLVSTMEILLALLILAGLLLSARKFGPLTALFIVATLCSAMFLFRLSLREKSCPNGRKDRNPENPEI